MNKKYLLYLICFFSGLCNSQQATWQWSKQAGSMFDNSNQNNEAIRDVKTDRQGNVYAVGYLYNLPIFENAQCTGANAAVAIGYLGVKETDAYLIKYNSCGNTVWRKKIASGNGFERAYTVQLHANGNITVFGSTNSSPFIAGDGANDTIIANNSNSLFLSNYDASGNFVSINTYSGFPISTTYDNVNKLIINSQGNYFITNGVSAFVTNPAGVVLNTYTYGVGTPAYPVPPGVNSVILDKNDNVYLLGGYNNIVVIGQTTTLIPTTATVTSNLWWPMGLFMKFSAAGNLIWYKTTTVAGMSGLQIDTSGTELLMGAANMGNGPTVFNYTVNSPLGFPILRMDAGTGNLLSGITATAGSGGYCFMRHRDCENNFFGVGEMSSISFNGTNTYSSAATVSLGGGAFYNGQMYFAQFNASGGFVDFHALPTQGNQFDTPLDVTRDEQGNIYMWGMFSGVLDSVGTNVFPFGGLQDAFIAKFGFSCSNQTITSMLPLSPSSLTAMYQGSLTNQVNWIDNSNYELGFELWYTNTSSSTYSLLVTLPANTTTYQHPSLSYSTNYCYKVKALNNVGSSSFTNIDCAATPAFTLVPSVPLNLNAVNNGNLLNNISWTDNSNNETGFELWCSAASGPYTLVATLPANTTIYAHANLTYTTSYCYKVAATNSIGTSAYSNVGCAITPDSPNTSVDLSEHEIITSYTKVFPNPSNETVFCQFPSMGAESKLEVFNSLGQSIQVLNIPANNSSLLETVPIVLPNAKGIYLIKITTGKSRFILDRKVLVD